MLLFVGHSISRSGDCQGRGCDDRGSDVWAAPFTQLLLNTSPPEDALFYAELFCCPQRQYVIGSSAVEGRDGPLRTVGVDAMYPR